MQRFCISVQVHYENMPIQIYRKFSHQKNENFQIKISDIFHISAQNIDCGYSLEPPRRGGSNGYPHSMFLSRNKEIIYTPVKPSFTIQKWGLRGSKLYRRVFVMQRKVNCNTFCTHKHMNRNTGKRSFGHVHEAKIQINLCIRTV